MLWAMSWAVGGCCPSVGVAAEVCRNGILSKTTHISMPELFVSAHIPALCPPFV